MTQPIKSSLLLRQPSKKQLPTTLVPATEVEYKQVGETEDLIGRLSDEEKQAEFNHKREQYIKMKLTRKMELMLQKKQEFGSSSSSDADSSQHSQQPQEQPPIQAKRSRGKVLQKSLGITEHNSYSVVVELKKMQVDSQITFLDKEFQVNSRAIAYSRITKISLGVWESKMGRKIRINLLNDEELVMYCKEELQGKTKNSTVAIFLQLAKLKLQSKGIKLSAAQKKCSSQQFSDKLKEDALICDLLYKKSQIIGTWEERYIVLKQDGVYSYRTLQSKNTMYIPSKQLSEIVTQFQIYKESLVVRLVYSGARTDFGVALEGRLRWLGHFANLLVAY